MGKGVVRMSRVLRKGENVTNARKRWQANEKRRKNEELERIRLGQEYKNGEKQRLKDLEITRVELERVKLITPSSIEYISGDKKLSILICSIKGRERLLRELKEKLKRQIITNEVEILVEVDDKKITIGAKRNILLGRARGDYVAFVDDDDTVSVDYIPKILKAIETSPDCCGIEGEIEHTKIVFVDRGRRHKQRRRYRCTQKFIHSIQYTRWYEQDKIYYRCPNHLNPIRREHAIQIMYPEMNKGEDRNFSLRILSLLETEVYIEGIIYFYKAS